MGTIPFESTVCNLAECEEVAERYYHSAKGVFSVIRHRALATVADCGISICLPKMVSQPVVNVLL